MGSFYGVRAVDSLEGCLGGGGSWGRCSAAYFDFSVCGGSGWQVEALTGSEWDEWQSGF